MTARRVLGEPLLHFLVLGALLFASYAWLQGGAPAAPDEIVVSSSRVKSLRTEFVRVWQRQPTKPEMDALVEAWVREEVLYREGIALALDKDDPVVRRRVAQKVMFIADGQSPSPPTDKELQAWLDGHPADYRVEPRYSLRQIYFNPAKHGDRLAIELSQARIGLEAGLPVQGDSTMLPGSLDAAPSFEVAGLFGPEFAEALASLPLGGWQGPVSSSFGVHLVQVRARVGGFTPKLSEVRPAVERDLLRDLAERANQAFYQKLRSRFTVRIEHEEMRTRADSSAAVR